MRRRTLLICIWLANATMPLRAAGHQSARLSDGEANRSLQAGAVLLEEGRTALDEHTLLQAKTEFTKCIGLDEMNVTCYYDRARTEEYLEQVMQLRKNKKDAVQWIDAAIADAAHAVALADGSSDAHALLGDLYGNKIGLEGMFAGAQLGPKVSAECDRALRLDPENPRAWLVLGHKYYFTPRMFGGSLDKAIECFKKASSLDPRYDEAFVWLAIAYRKKRDGQDADRAVQEALRLNPRSAFARRIQSGAAE